MFKSREQREPKRPLITETKAKNPILMGYDPIMTREKYAENLKHANNNAIKISEEIARLQVELENTQLVCESMRKALEVLHAAPERKLEPKPVDDSSLLSEELVDDLEKMVAGEAQH